MPVLSRHRHAATIATPTGPDPRRLDRLPAAMNKVEVLQLIGAAKVLWPSWRDAPSTEREVSFMADVWLTLLEDLPADLAYAALQVLAAEGRDFVPPCGLVRRQAVMLRARASGDLPPGVDEAWREIQTRVRARGRLGWSDAWSHQCVTDTVASIGWYQLCDGANQEALRAHFRQFYLEAVQRYERDLVLSDSMMDAISHASLRALTE